MFKNESMFQNIIQCDTPSGKFRFCNKNNNIYQVYRECIDKGFYYVGTISSGKNNPTCAYLYNVWIGE